MLRPEAVDARPLGLSPLALTTYQSGAALPVLLAVTVLHGIGAVYGDARAWLGLVPGLGLRGMGWPASPSP